MSSIDVLFAAVSTPWGRAIAVALTLAAGAGLFFQGKQLKTENAPDRVVSLELAKTQAQAKKVIDSWKERRVEAIAVYQILLDFVFIAGYMALLVAIALRAEHVAAAAGIGWLAQASHYAAYAGLATGFLDCIENVGMLIMLAGTINEPIAWGTWLCAYLKFRLPLFVLAAAVAVFVVT
jgi:hypothetical protein